MIPLKPSVIACTLVSLITLCSGCTSTLKVLDGASAACADFEADGYFTDSRATGRIIKVPEGTEVNQALIAALCPP